VANEIRAKDILNFSPQRARRAQRAQRKNKKDNILAF
jgi:hypothetical protein